MIDLTQKEVPPGQQLVARDKWPIIGERLPSNQNQPWNLIVDGLVDTPRTFSLDDLGGMKSTTLKMDIHCVTRWSRQDVVFSGVLLEDLLAQIQIGSSAEFLSFVSRSERNHSTSLPIEAALQQQTLIATEVDGQPLGIDHGGPIRNIVPGRYFYKSVKWLERIEVLAEDQLGFWEAETGYHNHADPWLEERYMAPAIDRRTAIKLIASRDFSGRDLRSIDASKRQLTGLNAREALLRDADFRKSDLTRADFTNANLSNAHLEQANLQYVRFVGTDLEGANLSGADLRHADLTGCSLIGSSFLQQLDDGTALAATLDATTVLPEELLSPLTVQQYEFVTRSLSGPTSDNSVGSKPKP